MRLGSGVFGCAGKGLSVALATVMFAGVPVRAQEDLTPLDVVLLKSVSGVFPSPDGDRVVFTRSEPRTPDQTPGVPWSRLYVLTGGGEEAVLPDRRSVGSVAWMPDGSRLTFLDRREGDPGPQLYSMDLDAREPRRVFEEPLGIVQYRWAPNGSSIAFTAALATPAVRAGAREAGFGQIVYDEDWNPLGLFIWDAETGEVRRIEAPGSVFNLEWSPDGTRLLTTIAPRGLFDDQLQLARLHVVDVAAGTVRRLVDNPGKLGQIGWSPDGSRIAFTGSVDAQDPHAGNLFVADAVTGETTSLTPGFLGMVQGFEWLEVDRMRLRASRGAASFSSDFTVSTREWADLPTGDFAFTAVRTVGDRVFATGSSPRYPTEIHSLEGKEWVRRTDSNPDLDDVALSRQEVYAFEASDGVEVEGILMYPLDFQVGVRYPLVVAVHGGPEDHLTNGWLTNYVNWGQLLSRRGFFVWLPNYRSSTGRGVAFAKADHGDLAGREFQDQLDAIDHFVDRGWVDPARVGLGGMSYGGYAGAWAATKQTDRYAAAIAMVPITHAATQHLTTDIPWEYYFSHYQEMWPTEQWKYMEERSPLAYAEDARTPLLLAGGLSDPRVHPSQPLMLYRAVKETTDTPVRLVQYPGEGHGNRTNVYQYDFLLRSLRWFEYYLRPGDHRLDSLPPLDVDYGAWIGVR